MNQRPIVTYIGGFARVGGVEAFVRDFLLGLAPAYPERELVIWGRRGRDHALLDDIARSGAKISRSPWRWGCAWRLPDYVLAPIGLGAARRAAALVFKVPPPVPVLRWLRQATQSTGRHVPFILIMPYRPLEYWGRTPNPREMGSFDVITVQSEDGRRDLEAAGYRGRIEQIPLLPPGVTALSDFPVRRQTRAIRLGFLGRLEVQKNLPYLLEVFRTLTLDSASRHYELHIYGDGSQRAELQRRCAELSLEGVTFHGEVPRAEVAAAIDSCDLFLNTSLTEGQCLVALEVLSRGRPLVATPVGALPEILRQEELGRLAPLDDPAAFARAVGGIVEKIEDGSLTPEKVAAVFRERFDRQAILDRYLDLLASLGLPPRLAGVGQMAAMIL